LLGASAAGGMFGIGWLAGAGGGQGKDPVQRREHRDSCPAAGFPGKIFRAPPAWAEPNDHKLIYWHAGHVAIREQPDLSFAADARSAHSFT
jgi:hypothetical protein